MSERKKGERFFFVSLGALFAKHGAAQTGILTNKSHYKEERSFKYLNFSAKLQAELFDVTHTLLAPRWPRSVGILGYFRERFCRGLAFIGS